MIRSLKLLLKNVGSLGFLSLEYTQENWEDDHPTFKNIHMQTMGNNWFQQPQ